MNINKNSNDDDKDPVVFKRKTTNKTWRRGCNFALCAREMAHMRNIATEISCLDNV